MTDFAATPAGIPFLVTERLAGHPLADGRAHRFWRARGQGNGNGAFTQDQSSSPLWVIRAWVLHRV